MNHDTTLPVAAAPVQIVVCMGSSCFSRGNKRNLEIIQQYLREHGLTATVELSGCLCTAHCQTGPNIRINGTLCAGVRPEQCAALLAASLPGTPAVT